MIRFPPPILWSSMHSLLKYNACARITAIIADHPHKITPCHATVAVSSSVGSTNRSKFSRTETIWSSLGIRLSSWSRQGQHGDGENQDQCDEHFEHLVFLFLLVSLWVVCHWLMTAGVFFSLLYNIDNIDLQILTSVLTLLSSDPGLHLTSFIITPLWLPTKHDVMTLHWSRVRWPAKTSSQ